MPKSGKDITRNESYKSISLVNIDAEILSKNRSQIHKHLQMIK